jgi:hypothetical protein
MASCKPMGHITNKKKIPFFLFSIRFWFFLHWIHIASFKDIKLQIREYKRENEYKWLNATKKKEDNLWVHWSMDKFKSKTKRHNTIYVWKKLARLVKQYEFN